MGLSRRQFTKEFKLAAVRRSEAGVSLARVARGLEVSPNVLQRWRREFRQAPGNAFPRVRSICCSVSLRCKSCRRSRFAACTAVARVWMVAETREPCRIIFPAMAHNNTSSIFIARSRAAPDRSPRPVVSLRSMLTACSADTPLVATTGHILC